MPPPATFLLVRHGETAWNREGRIQGQRDSALTATGVAQARAVAGRIAAERPDLLYTSDLGRARETARLVAEATGLSPLLEPALRERRFGIFEGETWPEIARDHPGELARHATRDPDYGVPGGESPRQFRARVLRAFDDLARRPGGRRIAVVTHGGVLDVLYREATGMALDAPRGHPLPNAALSTLRWADGAGALVRWGEGDHLPAAALDDADA